MTLPQSSALPGERAVHSPRVHLFYSCASGLKLETRIVAPERIEIRLPDGPRVLQQERTASGAKYGAGDVSFWSKGREATLDYGGRVYSCLQDGSEGAS